MYFLFQPLNFTIGRRYLLVAGCKLSLSLFAAGMKRDRGVQRSLAWIALTVLVVRWYQSLKENMRVSHHSSKAHPVVTAWLEKSKIVREAYRPPAWLSLGSQFLVGTIHSIWHNLLRRYLKPVEQIPMKRELLELECGGTVGLDWAHTSTTCASSDPIVFLHHGIAGNSRSHYVQKMVDSVLQVNSSFRVCVMVARGCGGVPMTTPKGFTAAGSDDMAQALSYIKRRNPNARIYGVGYSLGAGLMARYIGKASHDCLLDSAVVLSPCWDYMQRTSWFEPWSRTFLAKSLKDYASNNRIIIESHPAVDFDKVMSAVNVEEFDTHAVLPVHGYSQTDEYYKDASPIQFAEHIVTPTLSLSADDDPVCSVGGAAEIETRGLHGPGLVVARTNKGGHLSWAEGFTGYHSFMDRAIVDWIEHSERFFRAAS